jgi:hypothetical protein
MFFILFIRFSKCREINARNQYKEFCIYNIMIDVFIFRDDYQAIQDILDEAGISNEGATPGDDPIQALEQFAHERYKALVMDSHYVLNEKSPEISRIVRERLDYDGSILLLSSVSGSLYMPWGVNDVLMTPIEGDDESCERFVNNIKQYI